MQRMLREADLATVYYELKRFGVRYITSDSVRITAALSLLHFLGLCDIPISLLAAVLSERPESLRQKLHALGDKGVVKLNYEVSDSVRFLYRLNEKLQEKLERLWLD